MTAIVFDLDGTLVDTAPDINAVANIVLTAEGLAPIDLEATHAFIGKGVRAFLEQALAAQATRRDDAALARMVEEFERHYRTAASRSRLYPHVAQVLRRLRDDGHRLGVCTNKPIEPARFVLDQFALAPFFEVVVGGDSLPVKKPDPAPLLDAFARLCAGAEDRLYVGDSEVDARTAARAGIPFALFTEGYRTTPADALEHEIAFDRYTAIPDFVRRRFA